MSGVPQGWDWEVVMLGYGLFGTILVVLLIVFLVRRA